MTGRVTQVAVLGGSLVGLTAALVLRDTGCDVDVYDSAHRIALRTRQLRCRG